MKRLDFVEPTRLKARGKTLNSSAGTPICTPPNRPCGGRCIPPNWECHSGRPGVNRGAAIYRSNTLGAAGNFEAAGRELLALAQSKGRRNVAKSINRASRSAYKALVDLTPYPKLSEKQRAGKTEEEIQALEASEYSKRVSRTWGIAIGSVALLSTGALAFANRKRINRVVRTGFSRNSLIKDFGEAGVEWGAGRTPSKGNSLEKRLWSLISGKAEFSQSSMQSFRDRLARGGQAGSNVPFYSEGPGNTALRIKEALGETGAASRFIRLGKDQGTQVERRIYDKVQDTLNTNAALKSGSQRGQSTTPEEAAFKDLYNIVTSGGGPDRELDEAITRSLYLKYLKVTDLGESKDVASLLTKEYRTQKLDIQQRVRSGMIARLGISSDIKLSAALDRYKTLSDLDRLAIFTDPSLPAADRVAQAAIAKEWADSFSINTPEVLARRDVESTRQAVAAYRAAIARNIKTPRSPMYDPEVVRWMWGESGINLPAIPVDAATPVEGVRRAMRSQLNRVRFERGLPLETLTRDDLYRVMEGSGVPLEKSWNVKDEELKRRLRGKYLQASSTQPELLQRIKDWYKEDPTRELFIKVDGERIRYNGKLEDSAAQASKTDSAAFDWGWEGRNRTPRRTYKFDWGLEGRTLFDADGKPCGKSFIPQNEKCSKGAGSQPAGLGDRARTALESIKEVAREDRAAIVAGSAILGVSVAAFAGAVALRKKRLGAFAQAAEKMAKDIDVPPAATVGMKHSTIFKDAEKVSDKLGGEEAESIIFHVNGFTGGNGTGGDTMMKRHASKVPGSMNVAISNEEFNVPVELGESLGSGDRLQTAKGFTRNANAALNNVLKQSLSPSGNPVAIRLAANIKAYRDKFPGKPIVVSAWSAGTMVSAEADEILRKMGINDVSYVMFGPFHYGLSPKPTRSTYIVGKNDQLKKIPGMVSHGDHEVDSDHFLNDNADNAITKALRWYASKGRGDSRADTLRMDKPCGKSFISENEECGKQPEQQSPKSSSSVSALKITGAVGAVGVAGALTHFYYQGFIETNLKPHEIPPKKPPAGLYDSFVPGDLLYHKVEFVGSKRAHYGVYLGKKDGKHLVYHTSAKPNPTGKKPIVEMIVSDMDTWPDTDPGRSSFVKAPRINNSTKPPTAAQLEELATQLSGRQLKYDIATSNCEHIARALVNDAPRSLQMEKLTWLNKKLTGLINNLGVDNRRALVNLETVQKVARTVQRLDAATPLVAALNDAVQSAAFIKDPALGDEVLTQSVAAILLSVLVDSGRVEVPSETSSCGGCG